MLSTLMLTIAVFSLSLVAAQQAGKITTEAHPSLTWQQCTAGGGCQSITGGVVLDAEWRWVHKADDLRNCYTGNKWEASICSNNKDCAKNCQIEGVDDYASFGVSTSGNTLSLRHRASSSSQRLGSRVYLLANETQYQTFKLLNQEFSVDVDVSTLPCDINGAVSFLKMDVDGGMARFAGNRAGAKFGTGYCSARCPRSLRFINGEGNVEAWTPSNNDAMVGYGNYGSCCAEVDVWESNSVAQALTAHTCTADLQDRCNGDSCGTDANPYSGICDPDGCDFNPYRLGNHTFYGNEGDTVDSRKKLTVVTQFITDTNTTAGTLKEIRRLYVQNGKIIANPTVQVSGTGSSFDSINAQFCSSQKSAFSDSDAFGKHGGLKQVGKGLGTGMVLSFSILSDPLTHYQWLDSRYPPNKDPSLPGVVRGPCSTDSGTLPTDPDKRWTATYSNIKLGDIGTTFTGTT